MAVNQLKLVKKINA